MQLLYNFPPSSSGMDPGEVTRLLSIQISIKYSKMLVVKKKVLGIDGVNDVPVSPVVTSNCFKSVSL